MPTIKNTLLYFLFLFLSISTSGQNCVDTSFKIIYESPNANLVNNVHIIDNINNSFYVGKVKSNIDTADYILKTNYNNQVLWAKKTVFGDKIHNLSTKAITIDSNAILILTENNFDSFIKVVKVNSLGNIAWVKTYSSINSENFHSVNLQKIDSSIYLSFRMIAPNLSGQFSFNCFLKLDFDGNIIWSKYYEENYICDATFPLGVIKSGDSLITWGRIAYANCNPTGGLLNKELNYYSMKIDITTGNLGKSVSYTTPTEFGPAGNGSNTSFFTNLFTVNNINQNFVFTNRVTAVGLGSNYGSIRVEFDTSLNVINSSLFFNSNYLGASRLLTNQQGFTSVFCNGNPSQFPRRQYIAFFDKFNNVIRQKKTVFAPTVQSLSYSPKTFESKFNYLNLASNFVENNVGKIQLSQINVDEQTSTCFGEDTSFVSASAFDIIPFSSPFFAGAYNLAVQITNIPLPIVTNLNVIKTDLCQSISICSTLTVTPKIDTVCKVNNIYTYKASINSACKKHVNWIIDTAAISMLNIIDDTTVQIKFKKTWQGYLYANVNSCSVLKDSVKIAVYISPDTINLSLNIPSFCTTNTILLNAGKGFKSYRWQNGSTDSTFLATASGRYYVTAYDYCNNRFTDTITLIKYITRPPVFLGNDTTLCNNTNNVLHAGIGYKTYAWSNGSSNEFININVPGIYSVAVTDSCGNISRDTIDIKYFNVPTAVNLGADVAYCESKNYLFNAGSGYKNYIWQDGSTAQTFTANAVGKYYVTVTDSCGNKSSDTIFIKKTLYQIFKIDYPYLLCKEDTAYINLSAAFKNYTWSPNNNSQLVGNTLMLFPNESTLYNFTGETTTGCILKDTMLLNVITCPTDIYFPNAFSPNGDGANDKWKAFSQKRILSYALKIYNRYGQIIFTTSNINTGWNGMYKAEPQNAGTFIYTCSYKVAGKPMQNVKGTILLFH